MTDSDVAVVVGVEKQIVLPFVVNVTQNVTNVNDAPVISNYPATFPTIKTNSSTNITFTVWDEDTATTFVGLTFSVTRTNTTLFPSAGSPNFAFSTYGAWTVLTITPATGQKGTDKLVITVSDGTNSISKTNVVTVK